MPFKSKAQSRLLHAHPEKIGGKKKLKEWERATDYSHLPETVKPERQLREADFRDKQKREQHA